VDEDEDEDDDLEEDEADEGFMERWRQGRLQELTSGPRTSKMHHMSNRRTMYGGLSAVDGEGYLDAVDNSSADTVVVVYIYDEYVSAILHGRLRKDVLMDDGSLMSVSCSKTAYALSRASIRRLAL
jgi:hypothetical protein